MGGLRVAAAEDFVRADADGLNMRVAQGGANVSGGQRQRLAIARAVIRRPAFYLLDDALSALDVHTDARVRPRCVKSVGVYRSHCHPKGFDRRRRRPGRGARRRPGRRGRNHAALARDCPAYAEFVDSQSLTGAAP